MKEKKRLHRILSLVIVSLFVMLISDKDVPASQIISLGSISKAHCYHMQSNETNFSFVPQYSGNYIIETAKPLSCSAVDTVITLKNSAGNTIAYNNKSAGSSYSKVSYYLTAGQTYEISISGNGVTISDDYYLAIYKQGELYGGIDGVYSQFVKEFDKLDNYSSDYNCLAYALSTTTVWIWPFSNNPTLSDIDTYLSSRGYIRSAANASKSIIVYGTNDGTITHFAKFRFGETTAKMGSLELVRHNSVSPYYNDGGYGTIKAFYYDPRNLYNVDEIMLDNSPEEYIFMFEGYDEKKYLLNIELFEECKEKIEGGSSSDMNPGAENKHVAEEINKLGTDGILYLIKYILENKSNGYNEGVLVSAATRAMGYEELRGVLGDERETAFMSFTPKYYAYNLYNDMVADGKIPKTDSNDEESVYTILDMINSEDTNLSLPEQPFSIFMNHNSQLLPIEDYNEETYIKVATLVANAVSKMENINPFASYIWPSDCPESYNLLSEIKYEELKYMLLCVLESEKDGAVESYVVRTAFDLMKESSWETATKFAEGNSYTPDGPKYQAYNIYTNVLLKNKR